MSCCIVSCHDLAKGAWVVLNASAQVFVFNAYVGQLGGLELLSEGLTEAPNEQSLVAHYIEHTERNSHYLCKKNQ